MTFIPGGAMPDKQDVWGRPISVGLQSIFDGIFDYEVPGELFRYKQTGTGATASRDSGILVLNTGATTNDCALVESRSHPKYQPDREHRFSTATMGMDIGAGALYEFGYGSAGIDNSRFFIGFQINTTTGTRRGVLRRYISVSDNTNHTDGGGIAEEEYVSLDLTGIDLTKNCLWDITFQWRGAGDTFFWVRQGEIWKLAGRLSRLGVANSASIAIPTLPVRFFIKNLGTAVSRVIKFGCVTVTSVGGTENTKKLYPWSTANISKSIVSGTNVPIIAIKTAHFNRGYPNMRDAYLLSAICSGNTAGSFVIWKTYDSNVTGGSWSNIDDSSGLLVNTTATSFSTTGAKALSSKSFPANISEECVPHQLSAEQVFISPDPAGSGDMECFVLTAQESAGGAITINSSMVVGELL